MSLEASPEALSAHLASLGYDDASFPAKKLAWAFRVRNAKSIFSFLLAQSTLTRAELEAAEKLHESAAKPAASVSLQKEVEVLRAASLKRRVKCVERQKEMMSAELSRARQRLKSRQEALQDDAHAFQVDVESENARLNQCIERVVSLGRRLAILHTKPECLVSQNATALAEFRAQEERCAQELRRCVSDKKSMQEFDDTDKDNDYELDRLRASFAVAGMKRVEAEMQLARAKTSARAEDDDDDEDEIRLQLTSLKAQLSVEMGHLRSGYEERAQHRISRVLLARCRTHVDFARRERNELQALVGVASGQMERLSILLAQLDQERTSVRHVANLLDTLQGVIEDAHASNDSRLQYWKALKEEQTHQENAFGATLARLGNQDWPERLRKAREEREKQKRLDTELDASVVSQLQQWYPLQLVPPALVDQKEQAVKLLSEATQVLKQLETKRVAHETALKQQHPDIVAVERAMFALFYESPDNPTRLNMTLTRLQEKLKSASK